MEEDRKMGKDAGLFWLVTVVFHALTAFLSVRRSSLARFVDPRR